jgi:hypothetical protein
MRVSIVTTLDTKFATLFLPFYILLLVSALDVAASDFIVSKDFTFLEKVVLDKVA